ncbi:hypothetical protein [Pseudonocardia sp. GCM10023141]|uniref:hypothetical protein n=1 Tax=Pseudonocardia sp. GCM10023141 TaxID=3252653 RepID=UPI00360B3096
MHDLTEQEVRTAGALDLRLVTVLAGLTVRARSVPDLAAQVGLPPQRLRDGDRSGSTARACGAPSTP